MMKGFCFLFIIFMALTTICFANSGWEWQNPLPTANDLYAVSYVDANTGWAVGSATILKTTDGGVSWFFQTSVTSYLNGIYFSDTQTGTAGRYKP
jgi:photosystem II stability/assembly factor-like uncharacterized protein